MSATQDTLPLAEAKPDVYLDNGNPMAVLSACKKAAVKANWSLRGWEDFSDTAWECLRPTCLPEEFAMFMKVVEGRFNVTRGERFNDDPSAWAPH